MCFGWKMRSGYWFHTWSSDIECIEKWAGLCGCYSLPWWCVCVCVGETAAGIERLFLLGTRIFSCFRFSKEFLKILCWLFSGNSRQIAFLKFLPLTEMHKVLNFSGFACSSPPIQSLSFTIINFLLKVCWSFPYFLSFIFLLCLTCFFFLEPHVAGAIYSYFSRLPHRLWSAKIAQALGDKKKNEWYEF